MTEIEEVINIKEAQTQHAVHSLFRKRWSARSFTGQSLTDEQVLTLIEAAAWAPSAMNEQPWKYVYALADDKEAFNKVFDCLVPGNQFWAGTAGALIISLAEKNFAKNGQANRHALHDTGMATVQLLLQAASMDIYGHVMGGFDMQKTIEAFQIPAHLEVVAFIALGYLDAPGKLDEPFKSREKEPRTRKATSLSAFKNQL